MRKDFGVPSPKGNKHILVFMWRPILFLMLVPVWVGFFCLAFLHEIGHLLTGFLLGFPVLGIEIGLAPYTILKIKKFNLRIGKFPRGGRTVLSLTSQSFPRIKEFCFLLSGSVFESVFFLILFFKVCFWMKIILILILLDELWVNLSPRYKEGRPSNDGAFLLELLFPKKALKRSLKQP